MNEEQQRVAEFDWALTAPMSYEAVEALAQKLSDGTAARRSVRGGGVFRVIAFIVVMAVLLIVGLDWK